MKETNTLSLNATVLHKEFDWFISYVSERLNVTPKGFFDYKNLKNATPPTFSTTEQDAPYAQIVTHYKLGAPERIILVLALAPHLRPSLLDFLHTGNEDTGQRHADLGGVTNTNSAVAMATGETAM